MTEGNINTANKQKIAELLKRKQQLGGQGKANFKPAKAMTVFRTQNRGGK